MYDVYKTSRFPARRSNGWKWMDGTAVRRTANTEEGGELHFHVIVPGMDMNWSRGGQMMHGGQRCFQRCWSMFRPSSAQLSSSRFEVPFFCRKSS